MINWGRKVVQSGAWTDSAMTIFGRPGRGEVEERNLDNLSGLGKRETVNMRARENSFEDRPDIRVSFEPGDDKLGEFEDCMAASSVSEIWKLVIRITGACRTFRRRNGMKLKRGDIQRSRPSNLGSSDWVHTDRADKFT